MFYLANIFKLVMERAFSNKQLIVEVNLILNIELKIYNQFS